MTQILTASKEMERQARDNATDRIIGTIGPSIAGARAQIEEEAALGSDEEEDTIDFSKCSIREVQALNPVP